MTLSINYTQHNWTNSIVLSVIVLNVALHLLLFLGVVMVNVIVMSVMVPYEVMLC